MKCDWIKREGNRRLILVFAGWGSDAVLYRNMTAEDWDTLVCHDFDGSGFDRALTEGYDTVYLYAWSLGVEAASRLLRDVPLAAAFAVNGTEWPCDDSRGIPESIFRGTADTLSFQNLIRFRRRMFSCKGDYEAMSGFLPSSPDIEELRSQLLRLADASPMERGAAFWTRVYISADDRIFPAANQRVAWRGRGIEICERPGAHMVDFVSLLRGTIHDPEIVGRRFSASLSTYDEHASAQRLIAQRLISHLASVNPPVGKNVLEIGQGTGLSTRCFAQMLHPGEMDCVDLYETPHIAAAPTMRYHVADAEKWITDSRRRWDFILSSSAIQWFSDVRRFFENAASRLTSDGVLACATFAPGNLNEFDSLRPAPMLYRPMEELREWLEGLFRDVVADSEEIRITFATPREALLHLSKTGVGGSAKNNIALSELLRAIPRDAEGRFYLTYRPIYLVASRPR